MLLQPGNDFGICYRLNFPNLTFRLQSHNANRVQLQLASAACAAEQEQVVQELNVCAVLFDFHLDGAWALAHLNPLG